MGKILSFFLLILALSACVPKRDLPNWEDLAFWKEKKPAQVVFYAPEETWCYKTLAEVDCYTAPNDTLPERLMSVQPIEKMPKTREDHGQALLDAAEKKDKQK